ncbi:transmembrane receptor [Abeliophyllum distichum]|uniref:Transmembrane receptor n=1 Tax=Abeliophyllum distichum TaxID=126358 RepID=A0ABD1W2N3_9LAMI
MKYFSALKIHPSGSSLRILAFPTADLGILVSTFPPCLGFLRCCLVKNKLVVLNLYNCYNLTPIPDLSGHKSLEKVILELCTSLKTVHKSIGSLDTLGHLNLRECSSLVEFLSDVAGVKRLVLKGLPKSIGKLSSLGEFSLLGSALEELPHSIGFLGNLETLNLMWCESLIVIPDSIGNLKSLSKLLLNGSSIEVIPASVGSLCYLKDLSVGDCKRLHRLPVAI